MTPPRRCDLHLHSTCSDGTVAPADVVRLAYEAHLEAMALTDHDTFDGVAEAVEAGHRWGVRVLPGVELSLPHVGTFHMIALGVEPTHAAIAGVAATLRDGRGPRNREIVARLRALGMDVTEAEIEAEAGGDVIARPHIARVLVKKGYARDAYDAFDRFLGKGQPCYVDRPRVEVAEAVAAARAAGGVTIVCHPHTLGFKDDASALQFLVTCRDAGVDAVEVRLGTSAPADDRRWESLADRAGLLPSGGSDFHGENKPGVRVGAGRGRLDVPMAWLDALMERAATRIAAT